MTTETRPIIAETAGVDDAGMERRWQEWRARGARADRQTSKMIRPLLMMVAVAVVIVILGQIV